MARRIFRRKVYKLLKRRTGPPRSRCPHAMHSAYFTDEILTCYNAGKSRRSGEQNIWESRTTGEQYIPAYRHVADLARACAPRAALVFSINDMGHSRIDTDSYYPGGEYVGWDPGTGMSISGSSGYQN